MMYNSREKYKTLFKETYTSLNGKNEVEVFHHCFPSEKVKLNYSENINKIYNFTCEIIFEDYVLCRNTGATKEKAYANTVNRYIAECLDKEKPIPEMDEFAELNLNLQIKRHTECLIRICQNRYDHEKTNKINLNEIRKQFTKSSESIGDLKCEFENVHMGGDRSSDMTKLCCLNFFFKDDVITLQTGTGSSETEAQNNCLDAFFHSIIGPPKVIDLNKSKKLTEEDIWSELANDYKEKKEEKYLWDIIYYSVRKHDWKLQHIYDGSKYSISIEDFQLVVSDKLEPEYSAQINAGKHLERLLENRLDKLKIREHKIAYSVNHSQWSWQDVNTVNNTESKSTQKSQSLKQIAQKMLNIDPHVKYWDALRQNLEQNKIPFQLTYVDMNENQFKCTININNSINVIGQGSGREGARETAAKNFVDKYK